MVKTMDKPANNDTIVFWDFKHFGGWIAYYEDKKIHGNFHLGKIKSYPCKNIRFSADICDGYIEVDNIVKSKNRKRKFFNIIIGKGWIKFYW